MRFSIVILLLVAPLVSGGQTYYVSADCALLQSINGRGLENTKCVTKRHVRLVKHPTLDLWALAVPDDYRRKLLALMTEAEKVATGALVDEATMKANGWFPVRQNPVTVNR